jgi:hypothetical protein
MTCTAATLLALLGAASMPPRGTIITVPSYIAAQHSDYAQRAARNCARRFGIELRKGQ